MALALPRQRHVSATRAGPGPGQAKVESHDQDPARRGGTSRLCAPEVAPPPRPLRRQRRRVRVPDPDSQEGGPQGPPLLFPPAAPPPDPLLSARLLVDDRPSSPLPPSAARAAVLSLSLPVADVLPLSALRSLPLADSPPPPPRRPPRLPLLPHLLNNNNNTSKSRSRSRSKSRSCNPPVPINLSRESWPDELRAVCGSTPFRLAGGTCSAIRVGRASQRQDEIVANVVAAAEAAVGHVPRKWANVRAFHIKAAESLALPIYYDPASGMRIESKTKDEIVAIVVVTTAPTDGRPNTEDIPDGHPNTQILMYIFASSIPRQSAAALGVPKQSCTRPALPRSPLCPTADSSASAPRTTPNPNA
uniref:Uncharacterized protein n=1 Tax=Ananas comosus var. bracteatus TaxID=296719 RepID=A0A6V7NVR3_ANACO|nr:unnamed protein product [Ananas comosus var. bracteatus]